MSQFPDAIARLAIDPEFARHVRSFPDKVARIYRLTSAEAEVLRRRADIAIADERTAAQVARRAA